MLLRKDIAGCLPDAQRTQEPLQEMMPLEGMRRELLDVVAQLRGIIGELRPAGLEELGLTNALEGCVARLTCEGGPGMPQIEMGLDPVGKSLPQPVARCLFRVAQESLRNALKHAQAQHIWVSLAFPTK